MKHIVVYGEIDDNHFIIRLLENYDFQVTLMGKGDAKNKNKEMRCMAMEEFQDRADVYLLVDDTKALEKLRSRTRKSIFMMLTEYSESAMLEAFQRGADEVLDVAGVLPLELVARLKNHINRYQELNLLKSQKQIISMGDLEMNDTAKEVSVKGQLVKLTPTEYKILYLLLQRRGQIISNQQIYKTLWNMEPIGTDNVIAVHVRHLREKIEDNPNHPQYVQMVWGQGYRVG